MTKYLLIPLSLLALGGCAVARAADGGLVLGFEVGQLVETGNQAMLAAAGMVPGVGNFLQTLLIGGGATGLTVAGASKYVLSRLENRRRESDQLREIAERELAVAEAKLEVANGSE